MAYANGNTAASSATANPVRVFLDYQKGNLVSWNKEKKLNETHKLEKFKILDIGYTFKGKTWNETIRKFTDQYYSNEIKSWDEVMYVIRMTFANGQANKEFIKGGNWKNDLREEMKGKGKIHLAVTVLDINDGIIKEFFLSGLNFFDNNKIVGKFSEDAILSFNSETKYINETNKEYITYDEYMKLRGPEAGKYKTRYIATIVDTGEKVDEDIMKLCSGYGDAIDEYTDINRAFYKKNYGDNAEAVKEYAKLQGIESDEDFANKVKEEQKEEVKEEVKETVVKAEKKTREIPKEEISVEDIPFNK